MANVPAPDGFRRRLELCGRLAFEDYRHEWVISGCAVLALAAVLIPLLVLFGLKYGIITNLLDPLIENPRYLEIAPITAFARDGVFVSTELIAAVEDYRDGRAVPALEWAGSQARPEDRPFASFRAYAGAIGDVAGLRSALMNQGIEVRTSIADIELVERLDRNLGVVYWIIALIAIGGYCVSFATSVWANVDRKRREFSVLRLTGFRTREIVWFPLLQAAFTAAFGWLLAVVVYLIVESMLNALFASTIGSGRPVCRLEFWHLLLALLATLLAAVAAAGIGGRRVAGLEPSIGLRV